MNTAPLLKVGVSTTADAEDAVAAALERVFGVTPSTYVNERTKTSLVSLYLPATGKFTLAHRRALLAELKHIRAAGLPLGSGRISVKKLPRKNWAESWKKHFTAFEVGRRHELLIKPSWSKQKARPGQHVIVLDPGLSFGTGHHATTSFCLRELVRKSSANSKLNTKNSTLSVLDIGTGSGLLAIAAAKLGYAPIEGFDFDPESVRVAKENAEKNGVAKQFKPRQQDLTKAPLRPAKQFDFVCANLISNLLIAERRRILNRVKPGGTLVLAGILAKEFHLVQRAFEQLGLKFVRARNEREWRSGTFVR